jgi:hypothetical protein
VLLPDYIVPEPVPGVLREGEERWKKIEAGQKKVQLAGDAERNAFIKMLDGGPAKKVVEPSDSTN